MNRKFFALLGLALIAAVVALPIRAAMADGMVMPAERVTPTIRDAFTVEYHLVTIDVDDQNSTTNVDQKIKNVSGGLAQAIYMFPVPRNANIAQFSMWIGEKEMQGEMMEAGKAREIYQRYVRQMTDPALLEYVGQGVYRTSVFPFQKDESKRLRVGYRELLTQENGAIRLLYPLNTEKFSKYALERCRVEVNLKTTKPIKTIYSPSHEVTITRIDGRRAQVVLEANNSRPTTDFELYYTVEEGATGASLLSYRAPGEDTGYFVYMVAPGAVEQTATAGQDIVFVVDVSGSMLEEGRLIQAKDAMLYCIKNLSDKDRFNVIAFSDYVNPFKDKIAACDDATRTDAVAFVTRLRGEGGTNINDAFAKAFASFDDDKARNKMIIFLTDGRPTIGERDEKEIIKNIKTANDSLKARVFNFGVGNDVNAVLLDWVAQQNRGVTDYIRPGERTDTRVISFFNKVRYPAIADCTFKVDGVRVENLQPAVLSDLFAGTQMIITGKYSGQGEARVTFSGKQLGVEYTRTDVVKFAGTGDAQAGADKAWIEFLWAGRQIGFLLDQIRLNGQSQEVVNQIVKLSKKYGIPTPYTSFLVLEDTPMPTPETAERRAMNAMRNDEGLGQGGGNGGPRNPGAAVDRAQQAHAFGSGAIPAAKAGEESRTFKDANGKTVTTTNVITILRKTFYKRDNVWVDETIAANEAVAETVELLSDRFFTLAEQFPELNQYAARGAVKIKLGDKVYSFTAAK